MSRREISKEADQDQRKCIIQRSDGNR